MEGNDPPPGKAERGAFFGYIPPGLLSSPHPPKKQLSMGTLINHRPKNKLTPGHLQSTLGLLVGSMSQTNGPVGEMESAPSYWEDLSLKSVRSPAPNPGQRAVGTGGAGSPFSRFRLSPPDASSGSLHLGSDPVVCS